MNAPATIPTGSDILDEEAREVTIFEAVATHDIPPGKICNIVNFAWALDEDEYSLGLVRCALDGRRIYDCLAMGLILEFEQPGESGSEVYRNWQRYTVGVTDEHLVGVPR